MHLVPLAALALGLAACVDGSGTVVMPTTGTTATTSVTSSTTSTTSTTGTTTPGEQYLPCAVEQVLRPACWECHGETPAYGAPMPLHAYAHLAGQAPSGGAVIDAILDRVQRDGAGVMPPPPYEHLTAEQIGALAAWADDGLPAAPEPCQETTGTSTTTTGTTVPPLQCDETFAFLAHENSTPGDTEPFAVDLDDNDYVCFYFEAPWKGREVQALEFRPVADDTRVLHHMILYAEEDKGYGDGAVRGCSGSHPDAMMLAGWAPGGDVLTLPSGVGMALPEDRVLVLEVHYNNSAGHTDAADRSGMEVCTSSTPQAQEAAVHWLGTEFILLTGGGETSASGTCKPELTEPAQILYSWPHMHKLGVHFSMVINRVDGSKETVLDLPFQYDNQSTYAIPTTVYPGDTITSTCTWDNTTGGWVWFGPNTEDEMCYNFITAYPAGSFNTGGGFLSGGGDNFCLQ